MTLSQKKSQVTQFDYKVIDKITEFKKPVKIYDPEPFKLSSDWQKVYCFPFDNLDKSPIAKQFSGNSLGRIGWCIEPRKIKYDRTKKRYYITQILIWATQTRDKRYANKVFGINCMAETIGGISHKFRDYEEGVINQTWRMGFTPQKTLYLDTYPNNKFNLLYIDATSSISVNINYLRFDLLPTAHHFHNEIWKLHHQQTEYTN